MTPWAVSRVGGSHCPPTVRGHRLGLTRVGPYLSSIPARGCPGGEDRVEAYLACSHLHSTRRTCKGRRCCAHSPEESHRMNWGHQDATGASIKSQSQGTELCLFLTSRTLPCPSCPRCKAMAGMTWMAAPCISSLPAVMKRSGDGVLITDGWCCDMALQGTLDRMQWRKKIEISRPP